MPMLSIKEAAKVASLAGGVYNGGSNTARANYPGLGMVSFDANPDLLEGGTAHTARKNYAFISQGTGQRAGQVLIGLRGSVLNDQDVDWGDAITDASFAPRLNASGWPVHAGFNAVAGSMMDDITAALPANPQEIHIVGHSMGGAVGTLVANKLSSRHRGLVRLYTFGSPRVGDIGFSMNLYRKMGNSIHRYYFPNDPVTWLPVFPFMHTTGGRRLAPLSKSFVDGGSHGEYFDAIDWDRTERDKRWFPNIGRPVQGDQQRAEKVHVKGTLIFLSEAAPQRHHENHGRRSSGPILMAIASGG